MNVVVVESPAKANAVVLCVDRGQVRDARHGTTTLFAALDIAAGQVIAQCKKRATRSFSPSCATSTPTSPNPSTFTSSPIRHPQAPEGQSLGRKTAIPHPLHTHLCLVAQPGRALVRHHHPNGHSTRLVLQRQGTGEQDRSLRPPLQRQRHTLHVDRNRRLNTRKSPETLLIYLWDTTLVSCSINYWPRGIGCDSLCHTRCQTCIGGGAMNVVVTNRRPRLRHVGRYGMRVPGRRRIWSSATSPPTHPIDCGSQTSPFMRQL